MALHLAGVAPVVRRAGVLLARREQMKVRSSTRATSAGVGAAEKLLGRLASFSLMKVPLATISWQRRRIPPASRRTSGPDPAGRGPRPPAPTPASF